MPDQNPSQSQYLDMETGLSRIRGNKKIYAKMLNLFLKSDEFAKFEESISLKDYQKASDVSHAIKGMTGNLSLTKLFDDSSKLMVQLKDNIYDEDTIASYRESVIKTREAVEEAVAELEKSAK